MIKIKKGFTLIELIIVVFIIGLLGTIVTISISGAKSKSRDLKRISEITQLQVALDNYNKAEGRYPELLFPGESLIGSSTGIVFMSRIPQNFSYYDMDCYVDGYEYSYDSVNNDYKIAFCLEGRVDNYYPGDKCAMENKIYDSPCEETSYCGDQVADSDSNLYNTILIGEQCWFQENLKYLPEVHSNVEFTNQGINEKPGYGVYGYNGSDIFTAKSQSNYSSYGVLYNWFAVDQVDICPAGWHVPSYEDWGILTDWLVNEGSIVLGKEGEALKSRTPVTFNGLDTWGFTALGAGYRDGRNGLFGALESEANFWSSSLSSIPNNSQNFYLLALNLSAFRSNALQTHGFSIRCLKD